MGAHREHHLLFALRFAWLFALRCLCVCIALFFVRISRFPLGTFSCYLVCCVLCSLRCCCCCCWCFVVRIACVCFVIAVCFIVWVALRVALFLLCYFASRLLVICSFASWVASALLVALHVALLCLLTLLFALLSASLFALPFASVLGKPFAMPLGPFA